MQLQKNISLKKFNSFGIDSIARDFVIFKSNNELFEIAETFQNKILDSHFILGGGSNILFTSEKIDSVVLKNELSGIQLLREDDAFFFVAVAAGENWHQFVLTCIEKGWAGVENLSLIPGNVGASPIQNIGAYGVEIKDVIESVEAYHIADKCFLNFSATDLAFDYRDSIFKGRWKNQFIISKVIFRLNKVPKFKISYGSIDAELEKMGIQTLSIRAISDAVIRIRSSKLPNPALIGNAGSFFKNPSISKQAFDQLQIQYPEIIGYPNKNGSIKIAAGWLIEKAGWKGFREGDAGCHAKQALVLVNYGTATGEQILHLSTTIIESIKEKFGITLEREVNIL
jgi:UDP-N-acetylmuramate dehydrogenase